jgi:DNA repair exonuclease SbcCD ATPase subunit
MLTKLTLTNFQKLGSQTFEFKPGLNLITGPNWAGKSTLIRAILYALGGGRATRLNQLHLSTKGEKTFEVALELVSGETIIRGTRRILVLGPEGNSLASGNAAVTEWIEVKFGLSLQDFRAFRVSEQGEPDALLSAGSSSLTEHLSRVTGAKLIDSALDWLSHELARAKGQLEGYADVGSELETLSQQMLNVAESVKQKEDELHALRIKRSENEEGLDAWATYLKSVHESVRAYREYAMRHRFLDSEIAKSKASLNDLVVAGPPFGDLADLSERLEHVRQRVAHHQQVQALVSQHQQQMQYAEARVDAIQAELEGVEISEDVEAIAARRDQVYQYVGQLANEIRQRTQALEQAVCPTCRRPYETEVSVETQRAEIESMNQQYASVHADLSALIAKERRLRELMELRTRLWSEQQTLQVQVEQSRQQLSRLATQLVDVTGEQEQLVHLTQLVEQYRTQQRDYERYVSAKLGLENQIKQFEADLSALEVVDPVDEETIKQAEIGVEQFTKYLQQLDIEIAKGETQIRHEMNLLKKAGEKQQQLAGKKNSYEAALKKHESVDRLIKFLRKNRESFMQELWNQLLSYTGEFISAASNGDMTEFKREGGTFQYVENGVDFPVECASGMQTAILGVALKLALGAALGVKSPVLLLDEVTAAGSAENSATFVGLLREQAGQVLLVTHREADAALADWVVRLEG